MFGGPAYPTYHARAMEIVSPSPPSIHSLPTELLATIFSFLPWSVYPICAITCKTWNGLFWDSVRQLSVSPHKQFLWSCLKKMNRIQALEIVEHEVLKAPKSWRCISELSSLRTLSIWGEFPRRSLEPKALKNLQKLNHLECLSIRYYVLDDLEFLLKMTSLQKLYLFLVCFTTSSTNILSRLTSLQHLSLWSSSIGDQTAQSLSNLTGLMSLDLSYNPLSDIGITYLSGLTKLKQLDLVETKVTPAGVNKLVERLPGLQIVELPGNPLGGMFEKWNSFNHHDLTLE